MAAAQGNPTRQSQISRQMSSLEEALGLTLLDRNQKPHQLSSEGREIEAIVRNFSQEFETSIAQLAGKKETITIGAGESFILWFLIPLLSRRLPSELGRVRFRNLQSKQAAAAVSAGHIDLAIHHRHDKPTQTLTKPLHSLGYRLVGPKKLLDGKLVSWKNLPQLGIAALEGTGSTRHKIDDLCQAHPNGPQVTMECSSLPQILEACEHGSLIAIVPETAKESAHRQKLVLSKIKEFQSQKISLSLSFKEQRRKSSHLLKMVIKALKIDK